MTTSDDNKDPKDTSSSQEITDNDMTQEHTTESPQEDMLQEDEVSRLTAELAAMRDVAARAQADLVNGRERMKREKEDFMKFANQQCVLALLPVLDNLERAVQFTPEELRDSDFGKGVQAVAAQFMTALESIGVQRIAAEIGTSYDPTFHEVVMQGEGEKEAILEVFEHGYSLGGRVLRPAKVKVGN